MSRGSNLTKRAAAKLILEKLGSNLEIQLIILPINEHSPMPNFARLAASLILKMILQGDTLMNPTSQMRVVNFRDRVIFEVGYV